MNSAVNNTLAGTIPPVGVQPITFTPALGDNVTYTILNAEPQTFTKTVDKANTDIGDVLTYTVTVNNPNNFTVNNVLVTDATPVGTTYLGNLTVSAPFTGTAPATGITITSISPDDAVTLKWQVQVNTAPPVPTPITNLATVAVPNGASGITNIVSTQIAHAFISSLKSVDKANANIGDTLTYTVVLTNNGNTAASNVILTDPVPNGTTYVMGSLAASVVFTSSPLTTIHLTNAIAPGETVSLTYQVMVSAIPNPNPIPNTMKAAFTYTVNPLDPNDVNGTSVSNTVNTVVLRNNYSQQISDLIHPIALEEAAIGNIANTEGAKIQRMLALGATPNELLCVNKSVADMLETLDTLDSVLKQKLSSVDCQISATCMP